METLEPLVGRPNAHASGLGCFLRSKPVNKDPVHKKGSTSRAEAGMFMQVHPGLLGCCLGRTCRIPGSPRMNNLPRDHT